MQYNQLTYSRQHNLGNYESERIEMIVTIDEHENVDKCLRDVKIKVAQGLGLQPKVEQIDEVVEGGDVITADGETKDPATGEKVSKKAKKTTKKKTTKKAAKKKNDDGGSEGTQQEPTEVLGSVSLSEVKEALVAVWKEKGRNVADDILKEFGAKKSNELKEADYASVIAECEKVLK